MKVEVAVQQPLGRITLDVAFETDATFIALIGASGAGKTSLLNCIAGLSRPEVARVRIDGELLADTSRGIWVPPHQRRIGYVFQEPRLFPHLNIRHNLTFAQRFVKGTKRTTGAAASVGFDDVVELLALEPLLDRRSDRLSGGERQRVAIGRALLSQPRMLLLDEPLASVDVVRRDEVLPYLDRLREELDLPTVYVTHTWSEVESRAGYVVTLAEGRVQ